MILGLQDFSLFLENYIPSTQNLTFYSYYVFFAQFYLLCLAILVLTFNEDLSAPCFIFLFKFGVFLYNYDNKIKNFSGSYKIYFVFFLILGVVILWYSIAFIIKKVKSTKDHQDEEDLLLQENYEKNDKTNPSQIL